MMQSRTESWSKELKDELYKKRKEKMDLPGTKAEKDKKKKKKKMKNKF